MRSSVDVVIITLSVGIPFFIFLTNITIKYWKYRRNLKIAKRRKKTFQVIEGGKAI